jgi:two-component system OmpR family response regulator
LAKLLVVEDNVDLALTISDGLRAERHVVEMAHNGVDGLEFLRLSQYDVIVLDWEMPEMSGIELLRRFRESGGEAFVIMLTGKAQIADKESGLNTGADDYLTKPFEIRELIARVRALLRRRGGAPAATLTVRDIVLDPTKYQVTKAGKAVHLLPRDFALLEFFMRHPGEMFSVDTILARVWEQESEASPEGLRVAIRRLRKALDDGDLAESAIENVPRVGYRLKV